MYAMPWQIIYWKYKGGKNVAGVEEGRAKITAATIEKTKE